MTRVLIIVSDFRDLSIPFLRRLFLQQDPQAAQGLQHRLIAPLVRAGEGVEMDALGEQGQGSGPGLLTAVDELRAAGVKAGLIKLRVFRPFPAAALARILSGMKAVAVMDKTESFSACGGPLFAETRSACYDLSSRPMMLNLVYGLGGRDVSVQDMKQVYRLLAETAERGRVEQTYLHMGQREAK